MFELGLKKTNPSLFIPSGLSKTYSPTCLPIRYRIEIYKQLLSFDPMPRLKKHKQHDALFILEWAIFHQN